MKVVPHAPLLKDFTSAMWAKSSKYAPLNNKRTKTDYARMELLMHFTIIKCNRLNKTKSSVCFRWM